MISQQYISVKTVRLHADKRADLEHAASLLAEEKLVALPTETVYGLAANGLSESAIGKIFMAKNRPLKNPLILHVHDSDHAEALLDFSQCDAIVKKRFVKLAEKFWPGPLTIIAKRAAHIPTLATGGLDTVAVRVPNNDSTLAILKMLDFPLVMPSANLSTRPSPTCADHVMATLDGRIDAVIDDGDCHVGIESTVVKIDEAHALILRPGMIDAQAISACIDEPVHERMHNIQISTQEAALSPGQARLHYSPKICSVQVCNTTKAEEFWLSRDSFLARKSDFLLLTKKLGSRNPEAKNYLLSDDAKNYARELYQTLYEVENEPDRPLIVVEPNDDDKAWVGIADRLIRTER